MLASKRPASGVIAEPPRSAELEPFLLLALYALGGVLVAWIARALARPIAARDWILFAALPLIFVAPFLPAGKTPLPVDHAMAVSPWSAAPHPAIHNPALNDVALQFAPWAKAARMAVKEGELPWRNRWNGCGMPLAANGSSAAFFPGNLTLLALPLARAFLLLGALKLLLASSGMFLWLRELGVSRGAARFGAVIFAFSFAITPWLYHPAATVVCLWPWAFFAIEALRDRAIAGRAIALLTGTLALWPLAGHGEAAALGALFGVLWVGGRMAAGDLGYSAVGKVAVAGALAMGLTAFATLPQLRAIEPSNRLKIAQTEERWESVPWVPYRPGWTGGFVTTLFPLAYGDFIASPMIEGAAGSIVEMGFGHFGLVGWTFALCLLRPGSPRGRRTWILAGLMAFALGAAMGLPPFRAVAERLPGIGLMPPLRLLLLVTLAGSVLAAMEIDRLRRDVAARQGRAGFAALAAATLLGLALAVYGRFQGAHAAAGGLPAQRRALLFAAAVLALCAVVCLALFTARRRETAVLSLTALAVLELFAQGMRLYRPGSLHLLYPETPLVAFLRSRPPPFRVAGVGGALFPNSNVFAGVEDIRTHDPLERRDYVEFLEAAAGYEPGDYFKSLRRFDSAALDFLNVGYLVAPRREPDLPRKWREVYSGPDGAVYENREVLPRIFAPPRVDFVPSATTLARAPRNAVAAFGAPLRELLTAGDFAARALVLERAGEAGEAPGPAGQNGALAVRRLRETTNTVSFLATVTGGPVVAVASYVQDGGWTVTIDEEPSSLTLANGPFLAIPIPEGTHRVALVYRPPGLRSGLLISLATLVGGAGALGVRAAVRRRRAVPAT